MARKLAMFSFPTIILLTSLIFLRAVATGVNISTPGDYAGLTRRVFDNVKGFRIGTAEIAKDDRVHSKVEHVSAEQQPELEIGGQQPKIITVRRNGKGSFRSITDAINSIPSGNTRRTIVKIGPGVYKEKVTIDRSKPYIILYGDPQQMPRITFNAKAAQYGTPGSATVAVNSDYFMASNIIFENSAPKPVLGVAGAQAVAMRISGDKAAFYNCRFYGHQDTLCDDKGMHFFKDCYIRGTIDFIFGYGRSIYSNCKIESIADSVTAITAQGRSTPSDNSGFVFLHCSIKGTGNAYLSRAWKQNSRVVFAYTYMGPLINPKGWDDKGLSARQRSVFFAEYNCKGPGAASKHRVKFAKQLTDEQAKPFLSMNFIHATKWLLPPPKL